MKKIRKKSPENLEDLSIKELTEIRDNEIDKNLEELKEFQYTKDEIKEYKKYYKIEMYIIKLKK